ncbi:hypothetical protein NW759_014986 [Fusarium solani]|nr:hypothetical protein NW759_014986 [Fusarium solani]
MPSLADDYVSIQRLIYLHGHIFDSGKWDGLQELYRRARWINPGSQPLDAQALIENFRRSIILHDGSPKTHHLMHNPLIDIAPDGRTATAETIVHVLQNVPPALPMQTILIGTYSDNFAKDEVGEWHFTQRSTNAQFWGNVSQHVSMPSADTKS